MAEEQGTDFSHLYAEDVNLGERQEHHGHDHRILRKPYKRVRKLERTVLVYALAVGSLLSSGCLPATIIDSHERQSWQELNFEREKAGLKPVTWDEYHNHGMHM